MRRVMGKEYLNGDLKMPGCLTYPMQKIEKCHGKKGSRQMETLLV